MEIITTADPRQLGFVPGDQLLAQQTEGAIWWNSPTPCIVLSRSAIPANELQLDSVMRDQIPVVQRQGGGGTVYLDKHCLCIALCWANHGSALNVSEGMQCGVTWIQDAIRKVWKLSTTIAGTGDLIYQNQKLVGSSLRMTRSHVHYSCSIILEDISAKAHMYLSEPIRQPKYREKRNHFDFMGNLSNALAMEKLQTSVNAKTLTKEWENWINHNPFRFNAC